MELLVVLVGAAVLTVVGIGVGILMATRIDRWSTPRDPDSENASPDDRP